MTTFGPIGFATPWILLALIALPLLWWLLRAVPPAPVIRRFPGVALLIGLRDDTTETDRTPWWLLLLRAVAVAALIVGFAGPVVNPQARGTGSGPLLVLSDASWASARDWTLRQDRIAAVIEAAGRAGRPVALVSLTDLPAGEIPFRPAADWTERLGGLAPQPRAMDADAAAAWIAAADGPGFDTYWLSDGVDRAGRAALLAALETHGRVTVFETGSPVLALRPPVFDGAAVAVTALRLPGAGPQEAQATLVARGPDPLGIERELARATLSFAEGAADTTATFDLPPELRNRINRFEIVGQRSAAAVALADDGLRRREVALIGPRDGIEGLELLSQLFYLRQALEPSADLVEGGLDAVLPAAPDVIILADVARVTDAQRDAILDWVERGGLLVRFAGPRVAASDMGRVEEDPLLPVRLRAGGRSIGGAMSWGEPRGLRAFDADSPFAGLEIPADVTVSAQVLAQPDPTLAERTIAALADGTPMVTRRAVGSGQIVLFHITASADWSTLPLSGLFVQMLERLAISARPVRPGADDIASATWSPVLALDGFGGSRTPDGLAGVEGGQFAAALSGLSTTAAMPPGVYAAQDRRVALNVLGPETVLAPTTWPGRIAVEGVARAEEVPLAGAILTAALAVLLLDILATLMLTGRLRRAGTAAAVALAVSIAGAGIPAPALAQAAGAPETEAAGDDRLALLATTEVVLAFVATGDDRIDATSEAGMRGLSAALFARSSVEPGAPVAIDIERDELAFLPFLYWPVTEDTPRPSDAAYARLNTFLRTGGMILFDTRDADLSGLGIGTPASRRLQEIASGLNIPPLEPVPDDHVLTRTFYLIQDFPGRHAGPVWVEAAPPDAERAEGMPFRNLNDGVTPVVIGGNDWAAAWAVDEAGRPLRSVGRGMGGERQREMALRFGINLIMHVLTGNYKSDQVHVPALLERLGQ